MKTQKHRLFTLASILSLLLLTTAGIAEDREAPDLDGDGIPNIVDPDVDNDGLPNSIDPNVDGGIAKSGPFAGKHIGDHLENDNPAEIDIDGDELRDDSLGELDIDGDSDWDNDLAETDIDGDGRSDDSPTELDIDGDGRKDDDDSEDDIDGDGLDDDDDAEDDIDGDGIDHDTDDDIDGDDRLNSSESENDTDGDGLTDDDPEEQNDDGDSLDDRDDSDDDNDGHSDEDDPDHHPEDDEMEVEVYLSAGPAAPSGSRVKVTIQKMAFGEIEFEIDAENLPAGDYELVIDGVSRGILPLESDDQKTKGEVEYETYPEDSDERLLDFDVIGLPIEIVRDGVVYFSGTVPTPPAAESGGGGSGSGSPGDGVSPELLTGLSLILNDGGTPERLDFESATNGREVDLASGDIDGFAYAFEKTTSTKASLVVTFDAEKRDEYIFDFGNRTFTRSEYKDGDLDDVDIGTFES
jgi:hypothetical protein